MRPAFGRAVGIISLYGALSTALACAKLMKLIRSARATPGNIADVHCAAFRQARWESFRIGKVLAFANAARLGVYAALLACAGYWTGAIIRSVLMGFEKELGVSLGNVAEVFDKRREAMPGKRAASMILKTSIKYWPAEYHSQSANEAAIFLRKQIDDVSQIESVFD